MRQILKTLVLVGSVCCIAACAPLRQTTVIDSAHTIVRLGKGVRGPVYVQQPDGEWKAAGVLELPEGWYAGPME